MSGPSVLLNFSQSVLDGSRVPRFHAADRDFCAPMRRRIDPITAMNFHRRRQRKKSSVSSKRMAMMMWIKIKNKDETVMEVEMGILPTSKYRGISIGIVSTKYRIS